MPTLISERDPRSLKDSHRYQMVTLLSFYHLRIEDFEIPWYCGLAIGFFTPGNRSSIAKMQHCLLHGTRAIAVVECAAKELEVTFQKFSQYEKKP
jgi:hypothetical protein